MALEDGLISYWRFEEAVAPFSDSVGNNPFTAPGSPPTRIPGKVGKGLQFSGDPQHLAINDNVSLATGDTDFQLTIWVYLDSKSSSMALISKWNISSGANEFLLEYDSSSDRFRFRVSNNGTAETIVTANNFGSPSTATWYYITAWHDSVNDQIAIQVNNGTANTAAHSTGVFNSTTRLILGFREGGGPGFVFLGRLDEMGWWSRLLTSDEKTQLYNGGEGRTLPTLEFISDPTNTLSGGLVSYWKLDEASGTRYDFMARRHLTDNNTVTQQEGVRGHAAQFVSANNEFLSGPSSTDALLSPGDIDFSIACWVYLDSKPARRTIVKKGTGVGGSQNEYILTYEPTPDRFRFYVYGDGVNPSAINAGSLGSPSLATWYFLVAWHDSVANTINIQINNGTIDSAAHSAGIFRGVGVFTIGSDNPGPDQMSGRIEEVGVWNKVLTTTERTALYNSGAGNTPKISPPSLNETLISHWKLNELSGQRNDSIGTNHLTDDSGVGNALGISAIAGNWTSDSRLKASDNPSLSVGDANFTFTAWAFPTSSAARVVFAKYDTVGSNREFLLRIQGTDWLFTMDNDGTGSGPSTHVATATGEAPTLNVWYFIVCWYDARADVMYIQVNNGTIYTTSHAGGAFDGTAEFRIGDGQNVSPSFFPWRGRIDEVGFWKRKLTAPERSFLFSSRRGYTLPPRRFPTDRGVFN